MSGARYRDVRAGRHFRDRPDGMVELVVYRREESGAPNAGEFVFVGSTDREAEAAYSRWCRENYERHEKRAAARAMHGYKSAGR